MAGALWILPCTLVTTTPRYGIGLDVFLWAIFVFVILEVWGLAFRPFLAVSNEGVVVQNPLDRVSIPWTDIQSVVPGYYGIAIRTNDGRIVTVRAVQKPNIANWSGRRARADQVAELLCSRIAQVSPSSRCAGAVMAKSPPDDRHRSKPETFDEMARHLHADLDREAGEEGPHDSPQQ